MEIELYSRCFLQPLSYSTKHARAQGRNLPLFTGICREHRSSPELCWINYPTWRMGWDLFKPKPSRGNCYIRCGTPQHAEMEHMVPPAQEKPSPAAARRWFCFTGVHEHKEIPLPPGEKECSDRLNQVIFLFLRLSHFGEKKPFLDSPGENSQHQTVMYFCFVVDFVS